MRVVVGEMSNGFVEIVVNVMIVEDMEKDDEDVGVLFFCFVICLFFEMDEDGNLF